jgi:hypothetical protein
MYKSKKKEEKMFAILNTSMKQQRSIINPTYTTILCAIILGVSLLFSTATRSVFEVNKLGLFKIGLAMIGVLFFYDQCIGRQHWFYAFKINRWFNWGLVLVWLSNVASTVLSTNPILSIYGSYDRWEGLLTTSCYLFFTYLVANKRGLICAKNALWCIIIATSLSSLYGIIQSFGMDIVQWSLDPAMRVFGSINNPVHYCAIMGMGLPLVIGQLLYTIQKHRVTSFEWRSFGLIIGYYFAIAVIKSMTATSQSLGSIFTYILLLGGPFIFYGVKSITHSTIQNQINVLFNASLLIVYAMYLSYSRATWVGLTAALGLIFATTLIHQFTPPRKAFFMAITGCVIMTLFGYLFILFKLNTLSPFMQVAAFGTLLIGFLITAAPYQSNHPWLQRIGAGLFLLAQCIYTTPLSTIFLLLFLGIAVRLKTTSTTYVPLKSMVFIFALMTIQFAGNSMIEGMNFILTIILLFVLDDATSKKSPIAIRPVFQCKLLIMMIILGVILSPKIYLISKKTLLNTPSDTELLIKNADLKINSYKSIAIEGSARTSMWKSAIPWIKDHPMVGSGLDTIKYYYPKYRRSDYGRLEGGHNYTPDRLHNEYLNTMATKGILGGFVYYGLFIGGTLLMFLSFIHRTSGPRAYLLIGLIGGLLVYLGQIMFNFGVVATLVYFYLFVGLGMALRTNYDHPSV